ncbi:hypothetical protein BH10PSE9_BH10PSE9_22790 [soil metagenome]
MNKVVKFAGALAALLVVAGPLLAATPEQEKAFVDGYKKAFDAKDAAALKALLYTKGAEPMALDFYAQMMTADFGATITEISLQPLSADDAKKVAAPMDGPAGGKFVLAPKAYKKLVIKTEKKSSTGNSTTSSESFVAEADGKLVIATPAPVKK